MQPSGINNGPQLRYTCGYKGRAVDSQLPEAYNTLPVSWLMAESPIRTTL